MIHDRYLLRSFVKIFLNSVVAFVVIYITVNSFEEIDNFIDNKASAWNIARYYAYSIPFVLTYVVPVSLLLGTIFSLGVMARRNELTAFIASGVSLVRVSRPVLFFAIFISLSSIVFNDVIATRATRKSEDVKRYDIEKRGKRDPNQVENLHYLGENGYVYLARRYDHASMIMYDVVLQQFDSSTLARRIDAKRAQYREGKWVFFAGFDRRFHNGEEVVQAFDRLPADELAERPEEFTKEQHDPEHMDYFELTSHIDKVRKSGGKLERLITDLHFKMAYPLAGAIFALIGIAISSGKRKRSMATGFGLTLAISFTYYGVLRVGQTLGYNGVLPAPLAAQAGNIVFLGIGAILLYRANQ